MGYVISFQHYRNMYNEQLLNAEINSQEYLIA